MTCDYAACSRPGTEESDGWLFCLDHLDEHLALCAEDDRAQERMWRARPAPKNPTRIAQCGTRGGQQRHKRLGEDVCEPCADAERTYQAERQRRRRAVAA